MRYVQLFAFVPLLLMGISVQPIYAQPESEASVQFSVDEPASGALSQDRLRDIASTIRRLEKYPRADGAMEGRTTLVRWLQASPDVTVSLCADIASPFTVGKSPAMRSALQQHLLSTAAYELEHPEAEDPVKAKLSGLKGALQVYSALSAGQERGENGGGIRKLLQMQREGTLEQFVEEGVKRCQSDG